MVSCSYMCLGGVAVDQPTILRRLDRCVALGQSGQEGGATYGDPQSACFITYDLRPVVFVFRQYLLLPWIQLIKSFDGSSFCG